MNLSSDNSQIKHNEDTPNMLDKMDESPEVIGARNNKNRNNSSRYLFFKDLSPLVKSCNTFLCD